MLNLLQEQDRISAEQKGIYKFKAYLVCMQKYFRISIVQLLIKLNLKGASAFTENHVTRMEKSFEITS